MTGRVKQRAILSAKYKYLLIILQAKEINKKTVYFSDFPRYTQLQRVELSSIGKDEDFKNLINFSQVSVVFLNQNNLYGMLKYLII